MRAFVFKRQRRWKVPTRRARDAPRQRHAEPRKRRRAREQGDSHERGDDGDGARVRVRHRGAREDDDVHVDETEPEKEHGIRARAVRERSRGVRRRRAGRVHRHRRRRCEHVGRVADVESAAQCGLTLSSRAVAIFGGFKPSPHFRARSAAHAPTPALARAHDCDTMSSISPRRFARVTAAERDGMARRARGAWMEEATPRRAEREEPSERARRARMRAHDDSRRRIEMKLSSGEANAKAPEMTVREEMDGATRARAARALEETLADVREMNSMVLFGTCMTIRDAQLDEKRTIACAERAQERALDAAMERDRVEAIREMEAREAERTRLMKLGAETLRHQISEREEARAHEAVLRDIESKKRIEDFERAKALEIAEREAKRERAKALLEEVNAENAAQIERKAEVERAIRDEDERAMEYLRLKDARDAAKAQEEDNQRRLREIETARLRSQQERYNDGRAEQDAMRARKLQDAYERGMRAKEEAEKKKRQEMLEDLAAARVAQHDEKMRIREQERDKARRDAERLREEHLAQAEAEKRRENERKMQDIAHERELRRQIDTNAQMKAHENARLAAEAKASRAEAERVKAVIESIKARKLKEMELAAIPKKYTVELERKRACAA